MYGKCAWRSDVGSYSYHATKKHAVVSAGGVGYGYDAGGQMTTRNGQTISWKSYALPALIESGWANAIHYPMADHLAQSRQGGFSTGPDGLTVAEIPGTRLTGFMSMSFTLDSLSIPCMEAPRASEGLETGKDPAAEEEPQGPSKADQLKNVIFKIGNGLQREVD